MKSPAIPALICCRSTGPPGGPAHAYAALKPPVFASEALMGSTSRD